MYRATGCPVVVIYSLVAVQLAPDRPALPALGARAEDEAAVSTLEEDRVLLSSSCCGIRVTHLEAVEVVVSVQRADAGRLGLARARHDGLSAPRAHQREHPEHCSVLTIFQMERSYI